VTSSSNFPNQLGIGLMSGTSLDGIDAALVRFVGDRPDAALVGFRTTAYAEDFRDRMLRVIAHPTTRDLALLNVELGERFAAAAAALLTQEDVSGADLDFIASHGQTVWHEAGRATLQLGDPARIAERVGVRVVSDFRSRDVAAGGQGAPLVPLADALLFADETRPRVMLNIGGMANVTWLPPGGAPGRVIACDTGPGVAVLDAIVRELLPGQVMDTDGRRAALGMADDVLIADLLSDPFFAAPPPKSTGRETFGDAFAHGLVRELRVRQPEATADDCIATAAAFTAASIADQIRRWLPNDRAEVVVSGGGARHPTLMQRLKAALGGREVHRFDDVFFDGDAKEALAFALLGWLTVHGRPGNLPSATGAAGPRVLGRITPA
jgi:anhydro-N-acetylmuramic acid kinase